MGTETSGLRDILAALGKPEKYLCGVLGDIILCRRMYGSADVRIGTTGRGIAPHYRIEPEAICFRRLSDDPCPDCVAYHGQSHKELKWEPDRLCDGSWSSQIWTIEDVQTFLSQMRMSRS